LKLKPESGTSDRETFVPIGKVAEQVEEKSVKQKSPDGALSTNPPGPLPAAGVSITFTVNVLEVAVPINV
jgi:hypothetical protein